MRHKLFFFSAFPRLGGEIYFVNLRYQFRHSPGTHFVERILHKPGLFRAIEGADFRALVADCRDDRRFAARRANAAAYDSRRLFGRAGFARSRG